MEKLTLGKIIQSKELGIKWKIVWIGKYSFHAKKINDPNSIESYKIDDYNSKFDETN